MSPHGRPVAFDPRRQRRDTFRSGHASLDGWLQVYAGQSESRDAARTFVSLKAGTEEIVGYYTLVASSLAMADTTAAVAHGLAARFPVPVVLIARLAVDERHQGLGLGGALLRDAIARIVRLSEHVGVRAIVVDAVGEAAAGFYRRFGFTGLTDDDARLMVTLAAARRHVDSG